MATTQSGSFNTSSATSVGSSYPKYAKVSYNATFNEDTLKWDVTWSATAQGGSTATKYTTVFSGSVTIKKSSTTISSKSMSSQIQKATNDTVLLSGSFSVAPNETGDLTISIVATFQFYTTGSGGTASKTQSITLPQVAISSLITLANPAITISALSGTIAYTITSKDNYYHNLYYGASRATATQVLNAQNINNTSYSGSVPINAALLSMVPTASGAVYFYLDTFRDSACTDQLGATVITTLNVTVDTTVFKPTLTLTNITSESSPINGYLVAGYSSGKCPSVTANPGTGSSITRIDYTVTFGSFGTTNNTTAGRDLIFTVCPASKTDYQVTLNAIAYDQRGAASASASKTATVYGYDYPVITANIYRVDAVGDTTEGSSGEYVRINFSATQTKTVNGQNTIKSGSPYCEASGAITGAQANNTYPALDVNNTATFRVTCEDQVASATVIVTVNRAILPLTLYDDLNGDVRAIFGGSAVWKNNNGTFSIKNASDGSKRGFYDESQGEWIAYQDSSRNIDVDVPLNPSEFIYSTGTDSTAGTGHVISNLSSGATLSSCYWLRIGNLMFMYITVRNSSNVSSGSNIATADVADGYRPRLTAKGLSYSGGCCVVGGLTDDGKLTIRATGGTYSGGTTSSSNVQIPFIYIVKPASS